MNTKFTNALAVFFAAMMLISAVSGIAFAITEAGSSYAITQMPEVTVNSQTKDALSCIDEDEPQPLYDDDDIVTVMIALEDAPLLEKNGAVITNANGSKALTQRGKVIKENMLAVQSDIVNAVESKISGSQKVELIYNYTMGFNGLAVDMPYGMIEYVRSLNGVYGAEVSPVFDEPETAESEGLETQMFSANDMVGASRAWESGYNGEGMLIAVIDTGLYTDHEAFQTAPDKLKYTADDMKRIFEENDLLAESRVAGLTYDMTYLRDKIPFAFDYANRDCDVNHGRSENSNDHGTHVAGIVAADSQVYTNLSSTEKVKIKGNAPKAQLAIMKVFGDSGGGATWANITAAMEDCIYIGADTVNISIGEVSSFPTLDEAYAKVFDRMRENGINVAVAAGNYYSSAFSGTWNTGMQTTLNLENSMLTKPSTYREALCVASVNNTMGVYTEYISVGDYTMTYFDSALSCGGRADLVFSEALGGQTLEYVVVPGYGSVSDYEKVDVAGKIALVVRGGNIMFQEKHDNAYNAGAAAMILYDNVVQGGMICMQISDFCIPSIYVTRLNGLKMIELAENGSGTVYVSNGKPTVTGSGTGYEPSDFSSWGPLANLKIKPEISAPGGNIISSVDTYLGGNGTSDYASYSGTSMATPAVTGCMALVRQRVNELFPDLSPVEKADLVYALAMSTAVPSEKDGTPYGVRKQGAGVINADNAVNTPAYITVDGQTHPKIELGDDESRSGVYTLKFNVTNFGSETVQYRISPILTVPGYQWIDQGTRATYVQTDYNKNCTDMMTFTSNMQDNIVTVAPQNTVAVEVTMTVNNDFRALMEEVFKYGSFVEGYCRLEAVMTAEGVVYPNLSVCYLGYYGSWSECPVVESGFYYDTPDKNLSSMTSPNTAGSKINTLYFYELGKNPYFEADEEAGAFLADRCSISPANGDNRYDAVDYFLTGIVRNLSKFYYRIYDPETGKVYFEKITEGDFAKNDDKLFTGELNPMGASINKLKAWKGTDQNEGQTLMIRCGGDGYYESWDESKAKLAYWEIPVTVDNTAPYIVESHSEGDILYITVSDAHYAAYAGVFENETDEEPFQKFAIYENERNANTTIAIDMTGRDKAYLLLGDYACNEAQFEIEKTSSPTPTPTDAPTPTPDYSVYYQQAATLVSGAK